MSCPHAHVSVFPLPVMPCDAQFYTVWSCCGERHVHNHGMPCECMSTCVAMHVHAHPHVVDMTDVFGSHTYIQTGHTLKEVALVLFQSLAAIHRASRALRRRKMHGEKRGYAEGGSVERFCVPSTSCSNERGEAGKQAYSDFAANNKRTRHLFLVKQTTLIWKQPRSRLLLDEYY